MHGGLTADAHIGTRALTVGKNLTVNARTEEDFKVVATGSACGGSQVGLGGGLAYSALTNAASGLVPADADVAVGGTLHAVSNAVLPNPAASAVPGLRFNPPADTTGTPTSNDADRLTNSYQMCQALADRFPHVHDQKGRAGGRRAAPR